MVVWSSGPLGSLFDGVGVICSSQATVKCSRSVSGGKRRGCLSHRAKRKETTGTQLHYLPSTIVDAGWFVSKNQ